MRPLSPVCALLLKQVTPNGTTWVLLQGKKVISVACGAEHTLAALETGEVTSVFWLLHICLLLCLVVLSSRPAVSQYVQLIKLT